MSVTQQLDLEDIQGIVIHGYGRLPFVRYIFLTVQEGLADRARAWLRLIAGEVTSARAARSPGLTTSLHVAFTSKGLLALGFTNDELATFSTAFHLGMTADEANDNCTPHSPRALGDQGVNAPENWDIGGPGKIPHVLLILYASTEEGLDKEVKKQMDRLSLPECSGFDTRRTWVENGYLRPDHKEHFGFVDGISQPAIEGSGRAGSDGRPPVKAGEFVLGYRNEYGEMPSSPTVPASMDPNGELYPALANSGRRDLGRNGTYLVYRKLSQDVRAFWRFAHEHTKKADGTDDPAAATHLAARIMGRWPSGAPLVLSPDWDNPKFANENAFNYAQMDPNGFACPFGAHIRRAEPRDELSPSAEESLREGRRHRMMRRGRIYGPWLADPLSPADDKVDRGLQFIVINANIHRQFEFVQQTWLNNPRFHGLYRDPDPLVGVAPHGEGRCLTIQGESVRRSIRDLPYFVTVKGGAYFFLPSLRGVRYIAQGGYAENLRALIVFSEDEP